MDAVNVPGVACDWGWSAQRVALPRVVLTTVSGPGDYDFDGDTGYRRVRVQVDCLAGSTGAAKLLARHVKRALSGWRAGPILGVFLDLERDLTPEVGDAATQARVSLDFFIHHRES